MTSDRDSFMLGMEDVVQRGNKLQASFFGFNENSEFVTSTSPELTISGAVKFQVKVSATQMYQNFIFIRFYKIRKDDDLTYTITLDSSNLHIDNKVFHSDDGTWQLLKEYFGRNYNFNIRVVMGVMQSSSFATLYYDDDMTDFELRGEDGCVRVHRAVLAACSPVLHRMLSGSWRETTEGHVDVPGTSKKTLQHLKDFIYLHTLPESGIEAILLLASYYMMPGLEQMCVDRLVSGLVAEGACELLQLARKHRLTRLMLAVLDCVQSGALRVSDMRQHYKWSNLLCGEAQDAASGPGAADS